MSRRDRKGLSPSLFPFLAVLVCTLGTLILLLALVAQNATNAAEQTARNETPERPAPPRDGLTVSTADSMLKEQVFRLEELVSFREEQTTELGERRDALTYIEEQLASTRERLKELNDEISRLNDTTTDSAEIDQQMLQTVLQQVDSEKKTLAKLREETSNQAPRIVIVPHKGPNGTDRRPIYVECSSEGVTIFPEGNRITLNELERSVHSTNPLDAALRTIRLHALGQYNDAAPPYPLLVVRPDGIESYAAARGAMQDWDDQFGYELVPTGIQLAYETPDPVLKQKVDLAIRQAASQQRALGSYAKKNGRQLKGYSQGSSTAGNPGKRRLPVLSAASLDREGRASGFRSQNDPASSTTAGTQNSYARGSGYGNPTYQARANYANQALSASQGQIDAGDEARQWAAKMESATRDMKRVAKSGEFRKESNSLLPGRSVSAFASSDSTNQKGFGEFTGTQTPRSEQNGSASKANSKSRDSAFGNKFTDGSSEQSTGNEQGSTAQESLVDQGSGRTDSQLTQTRQSGDGGTQNSGDQTQGQPESTRPQQQANAQPMRPQAAKNSPRFPLRREGRNWAIPRRIAGMQGNAVVRAIRIECHPDHFVLLASGATGTTEVFGFDVGNVNLDRATLQLAAAIRERVDRWGPALPGGRWEPQLRVTIMPGSESRYTELKNGFSGSGIEVIGRRWQ